MKRIRFARALAAALGAAGTFTAIAAYGNGLDVGLATAPVAAVIAFAASWIIQRWWLGGPTGQQIAVVLSTVLGVASVVALVLNRGEVGPGDIASGLGLLAIGIFAFWPPVLAGLVGYLVIDRLIVHRTRPRRIDA